jgi:hypothetical protein
LKETFRIIVDVSCGMFANVNAGAAKNALLWIRADAYLFLFALVRDVGRFNRTNAYAAVAPDAFFFFQVYIRILGRIHIIPLRWKLLGKICDVPDNAAAN